MNKVADAVVIGGGMLGIGTAHALATRGLTVSVVEAVRLAGGTTGNSFAWLNATSKTEDATYHRLNRAGMERYGELAETFGEAAVRHGEAGEISWSDPSVADSDSALTERAKQLTALDYPVEWLDADDLAKLEPNVAFPEGAVGLMSVLDRWLDAPRLVRRMAQYIERLGGAIHEDCAVTGFTRSANGAIASVETYAGTINASHVIIAAGVMSPRLVALAAGPAGPYVPVDGLEGLLIDVPPDLGEELAHHILHPPEAGGLHFRPGDDGGLLIGAEDMAGFLANADEATAIAHGRQQLLSRALKYLPRLPMAAAKLRARARVGVRPMPEDGLPIVGPVDGVAGLYVMATHSGITLGPLLGSLVAEEIVTGTMPEMLAPYRPQRFQQL